jgi:beta-glucosidase
MKTILLSSLLLFCSFSIKAQRITPDVQKRADSITRLMTIDEKISYLAGTNVFYLRAIPRLHLPEIRMSDGPQGVRDKLPSTMFPCGMLASAMWDRDLVYEFGQGLGQDCRTRGIHILLGPGVNIYRAPMCGRNFEYFGEDPYLSGEVACQYIRGVQSQGVAACVKHFAANNQEWDRYSVSSDVDERTLHEIYLPAFKKAVQEADVAAMMSSYNLLNDVYTSEHPYLVTEVLRNRWGFKGLFMSDWGAVHSCVPTIINGVDVEMPGPDNLKPEVIMQALKNGLISEKMIDVKVAHILSTLISFGFLDREQKVSVAPGQGLDTNEISLKMARSGVILLKNEGDLLPLTGKRVLVLGDNAATVAKGGGSGAVSSDHVVSLLQGLKNLKGSNLKIQSMLGAGFVSDLLYSNDFYTDESLSQHGLKASYYKNKSLNGNPDYECVETVTDHDWGDNAPISGFPENNFSLSYTGIYSPKKSGTITFRGSGDDGYRLYVNDKLLLEDWGNHTFTSREKTLEVEAGKSYKLRFEYFDSTGTACMRFAYFFDDEEALKASTRNADAVVVCVGFDSGTESEGFDRTFDLPSGQAELINKVASYNQNVIVVINSGGGVNMLPWIDKVKAVIMAFYPGQEGGTALAEILSGKVSPSGKLPFSIEKQWSDNPTFNSYYDNRVTADKRVQYSEGVFVGYRGYERNQVAPLYPFGFGLSYSKFQYSNLAVKRLQGNNVEVTFKISNTGKRNAAEVAQLYVGDTKNKAFRPVKELKGYEKVFLKKGESKEITIKLKDDAFAYYDINSRQFIVSPGEFQLYIGSSSQDIQLEGKVSL